MWVWVDGRRIWVERLESAASDALAMDAFRRSLERYAEVYKSLAGTDSTAGGAL